jgi:hypothetical protein
MKKFLLLFSLFFINVIGAQEKIITDKNSIIFEASVPFFEPVEAKNNQIISILDPKKGHIIFIALIKGFQFERSLMKDHFNANYMESKKYPKATFKGLIEKFEMKNINDDAKDYYIKGKINIHGKTKNIRVLAKIKKTDKGIELKSNFDLNTDDFDINIPFIVRSKISKNVHVMLDAKIQ